MVGLCQAGYATRQNSPGSPSTPATPSAAVPKPHQSAALVGQRSGSSHPASQRTVLLRLRANASPFSSNLLASLASFCPPTKDWDCRRQTAIRPNHGHRQTVRRQPAQRTEEHRPENPYRPRTIQPQRAPARSDKAADGGTHDTDRGASFGRGYSG